MPNFKPLLSNSQRSPRSIVACWLALSAFLLALSLPVHAQLPAQRWGEAGYNWAGDFNGDGKTDLASAFPEGEVLMRLNVLGTTASDRLRQGQVTPWRVTTPWGSAPYTWAKDFDGDGKTDLLTAIESRIYLHLSDGTQFNTRSLSTENRWGDAGYNWTGDFNGDGKLDLASALPDGAVVMRLFNGTDFTTANWPVTTPWGGSSYVWAADFDDDGKTDLLTAIEGNLYWHRSTGSQFATQSLSTENRWGGRGYNRSGDFNGDGKLDLASALPDGTMVMRFHRDNNFTLDDWRVTTPWGGAAYSWAEDFDGDGKTDLVSAAQDNLYLHLSTGAAFNSQTLATENRWGEAEYNWTGDFDRDGKLDIASATATGDLLVRRFTGADFLLVESGS